MQQHRFVREGREWYIDLPEYLAQGGSKGDLQMVAGADTMLGIIAGEDTEVALQMDTQPFAGADELVLTQRCDPILGGGYYHLKSFEGKEVSQDMWLCEVTRFVFDDIPERIFVKRVG
jgi:hypothetical protein